MLFTVIIEKYKDVIPYLFFGICTTLVNISTYYICAHTLSLAVMASTVIAWILAVLFAYVTNRTWVFHSQENTSRGITTEILSFFACRLTTGAVDWGCMLLFVEVLRFNDVMIKILSNIVVIILNYLASKLIVFR